jgi:hypothetical protein
LIETLSNDVCVEYLDGFGSYLEVALDV